MKVFSILLTGILVVGALPAKAADIGSTVVTFNEPIEIPGHVLAAGTYVFRTTGSSAEIVEVFDADETHLLAMMTTIGAYRRDDSKPIVLREPRASGSPVALLEWFAPGDMFGHEFIYERVPAQAHAGGGPCGPDCNSPVPSAKQ